MYSGPVIEASQPYSPLFVSRLWVNVSTMWSCLVVGIRRAGMVNRSCIRAVGEGRTDLNSSSAPGLANVSRSMLISRRSSTCGFSF